MSLTQTKTFLEGTASVALDDIVVTDVDTGDSITATLTLALPAAGALTTSGTAAYTAGTGVWTVTGTVAQVNAALAAMAFVPAVDNAADTTISTQIRDAAGAGPIDHRDRIHRSGARERRAGELGEVARARIDREPRHVAGRALVRDVDVLAVGADREVRRRRR